MLFFCLGFFRMSMVLISHISVLTEFFMFVFVVVKTGTGFGISQSSRLSSSVSAMRVLNTGSDVEEAVADALVRISHSCRTQALKMFGTYTLKYAKELVIHYFIGF